jgi:hypothetical protein
VVADVSDAHLSPRIICKVMNAFVLRIVLHMVFEHPRLAGKHSEDTKFAQSRILVN